MKILVAPGRDWIRAAVASTEAEVVDPVDLTDDTVLDAVVWTDPRDAAPLRGILDAHPEIRWVQLPWAGIEAFVTHLDRDRVWTSGKGVYADPVAEQALMFALSGLRGMATYAHADTWSAPEGRNLLGANVTIAGAGGITESLLRLLAPFGCTTTVMRRRPEPMPGADRTITFDQLDAALWDTDVLVLALALTPETRHLLDARRLALLPAHAWVVNVARGGHIVTDDLVHALATGVIAGAGLDVVDPEPLPDGHPLWTMPNCLITPHIGNTPDMAVPLLRARIQANVARFAAGDELIGIVDVAAGY